MVLCLLRPTLVVRAAVDQQNVVAVLLDDSRSMQVPDWGGQPRANFVRQQFGAATSPVVKALSERFLTRLADDQRIAAVELAVGADGAFTYTLT